MQGRHDPPLTPMGREQAKAARRLVRVPRPEAGPYVSASAGIPDRGDRGRASRSSRAPAPAGPDGDRYGDLHRAFLRAGPRAIPRGLGGVSAGELGRGPGGGADRGRCWTGAHRVWDLLAEMAGGGAHSILCVTHSGFLQWILRWTLGSRTWMPLFAAADNCCVSHLRIENRAV